MIPFLKRSLRIVALALGVLLAALFVFFAGWYVGYEHGYERGFLSTVPNTFEGKDFSVFFKAWQLVKKHYVNAETIDPQKAVYGSIRGMVRSIGDKYSDFFEPQKARVFNEDVSGSFDGIGIEIGIRKELLTVVSPLEGTPAWKAGLKAGDVILKIDGKETFDMALEEAVRLIRGKKGTVVTLTILRKDAEKPKDIEIVRDKIVVETIRKKFTAPDIGYIKINTFNPQTYVDFFLAADELTRQGARRLILDLRGNPGGYLDAAVDLAGWFLKRGSIVVQEDFGVKGNSGGPSQKKKVLRADGNEFFAQTPLVVLIDEGTASASEILAAALRENRGVTIIGQKSFGKGTVQQVFDVDDSILKLTIANWLTPKGNLIEEKGIEPDVIVKDEKPEDEIDEALEKAVEIVKSAS